MTDMYYNGNNVAGGTTTWTLSGLTAGMTYDTRIYTRQWGASDSRLATFVFDPDGGGAISDSTAVINQDDATSVGFTNANDAYYINYQFKAVAGEDLVITATQRILNYSWHLYGISNQEVADPNAASHPSPANGVEHDNDSVYLSWTGAALAAEHDVYFGTDFDDVNDATASEPPVDPYKGRQTDTTYEVSDLVPGTTYYWRIDAVDDPNVWKGKVWSFWLRPWEARNPSPLDGAMYMDPNVDLSWSGGFDASLHEVFFGTDPCSLESIYKSGPTTCDPGPLLKGTTYYWQVKEYQPEDRTTLGPIWSFSTRPYIPITDPNLIGWWKLDEGKGANALDWSGHGNHGTLNGDPQWVVGYDGGALEFDGSGDYVEIGYSPELSLNEFTVSAWVNIATEPGTFAIHGTRVGGDTTFDLKVMGDYIHGDIGDGTAWINTAIDIGSGDTGANGQGGDLAVDTWYIITYVIDNTNQQVRLYLDADLKRTIDITGIPLLMKAGQSMRIGDTGYSEWMNGLIDDVRVYDRSLSIKEIKILAGRLGATSPNPADGATGVSRSPLLSWEPGVFAADVEGYQLYFSSDATAVANRTATMHPLTDPTYSPGTLDLGETYYWAVDTVNDPCNWSGDLWSFETVNYLVIDDMDSYTIWQIEGNNIFEIWHDGVGDCNTIPSNETGSTIGVETVIVHDVNSMKYNYDNDGSVFTVCEGSAMPREKYSMIEAQAASLPSGIGTDWTAAGVKSLSLQFYGDPINVIEPLWVKLTDASDNFDKVTYGTYDDEDVEDINEASWHEWVIDLADYVGVDKSNVKSIQIGIGTEGTAVPGGSGVIYLDTILLYIPRCVPSRSTAAFALVDYVRDCVVDYQELDVMFNDWLQSDRTIVAAAPNPAGLLARYEFEGDYTDSSGNGKDGTPVGAGHAFIADPPRPGQVLSLPGGDDIYVNCGAPGITGAMPRSIAGWARAAGAMPDWSLCFGFTGASGDNRHFNIGSLGGPGGVGAHCWGWEETIFTDTEALEWHHYAATYDGTTIEYFGDGMPMDTDVGKSNVRALDTLDQFHVGKRSTQSSSWFGSVDDVKIYNYALSEEEVVSAAGLPELYVPVTSPANISDLEPVNSKVVNFKDYGELIKGFLDVELWP
ncbi:MAG: hypothetical protein KAY65_01900 [Planctomycetes bacterium]|nr:hypothetical protein [Planctomycetota bacterium]